MNKKATQSTMPQFKHHLPILTAESLICDIVFNLYFKTFLEFSIFFIIFFIKSHTSSFRV